MCDIYMDRCHKCDRPIDMHLGDFDTDESEIEVYCEDHKPEDKKGVLWITDKKGSKYWVVPLTKNAIKNRHMNHPNWGCVILKDELEKK